MKPLMMQLGRALALLALGFVLAPIFSLLVVMVAWAVFPDGLGVTAQSVLFGATCFVSGITFAFLFGAWWGRPRCRRQLALVALGAVPIYAWLVWDEPATARLPLPGTLPQGGESAGVLRQFASFDGRPITRVFAQRRLLFQTAVSAPEWRLFLSNNRAAVSAEWDARKDLRDWIFSLDRYATIGDLPRAYGYSIVTEPFDYTVDLHCAFAGVLALEGRGDEAIDVLQPMLSVCRKLGSDARTTIRFDIVYEAQGRCQAALRFVLKTSMPSARALESFAAALKPGDINGQWRRLLAAHCHDAIEESARQDAAKFTLDGVPWVYRPFLLVIKMTQRCVLNPGATVNLIVREHDRLASEAGEGRAEGVRAAVAVIERDLTKPGFKNFLGRHRAAIHFRHIDRPVKRAWTIEDDRRVLQGEVEARLADLGAPTSGRQP